MNNDDVLGQWAVIDVPVDVPTVSADFATFFSKNAAATLISIDTDNKGATKDVIA